MKVRGIVIEGGMHGAESIEERPDIRIRSWRVVQIDDGTRHFIGYDIDAWEGRVSSAIAKFDPGTRKGVTKSGRVYELIDSPGSDLDADYVWRGWKRINKVIEETDETGDYISC